MKASPTWKQYELDTWSPPADLTGTEWGEKHITLGRRGNAEPGPWRVDRFPFWRRPLNDMTDEFTQYITIMKGVQTGGSTTTEIAIGFWVDCWAADVLLVFPTEKATGERLKTKLRPLIEDNERLSRWTTGDRNAFTKDAIELSHCTVYPAWVGSAQTLASRSLRCTVWDETDKNRGVAAEASPGELIDARTTAYKHRRKNVRLSTPTSREGEIAVMWENCPHKRRWFVPCPHCAKLILLKFEHVSWPGDESDEPKDLMAQLSALEEGHAEAVYRCQECGEAMAERDRVGAIEKGQWVQDGLAPGDLPRVVSVAYHLPSVNSPFVDFNRLAGEYIKCLLRGDSHNFSNSLLAIPFEDTGREMETSIFTERATHTPRVAPSWTTCITSGADTQAEKGEPYWFYTIRAWGQGKGGLCSRLLDYGKAYSVSELREKTLETSFPVEGQPSHFLRPSIVMVDSGGGVDLAAIDGNTRDLVYEMALADPQRVIPIKGHGGTKAPDTLIKTSQIKYSPRAKAADPRNVQLQILDTQGLKDRLSYLVKCNEPVLWEESTAAGEEYASHMSGESKMSTKVGTAWVLRWKPKTNSRRVDWLDASVYCLAGAMLMRADKRSPEVEARISPRSKAAPRRETNTRRPRSGGGWLAKRPGRR